MTSNRTERIAAIFDQAAELPAEQRHAFLEDGKPLRQALPELPLSSLLTRFAEALHPFELAVDDVEALLGLGELDEHGTAGATGLLDQSLQRADR